MTPHNPSLDDTPAEIEDGRDEREWTLLQEWSDMQAWSSDRTFIGPDLCGPPPLGAKPPYDRRPTQLVVVPKSTRETALSRLKVLEDDTNREGFSVLHGPDGAKTVPLAQANRKLGAALSRTREAEAERNIYAEEIVRLREALTELESVGSRMLARLKAGRPVEYGEMSELNDYVAHARAALEDKD